jgi:hypothetical protein
MNLVTALAIVIGVLGAIATWLFLGPAGPLGLQIWVAFVGWASFFHCGGGEAGLKASVPANVWGAIMGTIALILVGQFGGGGLVVVSLIVGVTVFVLIIAAHLPLLASIPAGVYGYASAAAYGLLMGEKASATGFGMGTGVFTTVAVSLIVGALFGWVSGKIAGAMAKA